MARPAVWVRRGAVPLFRAAVRLHPRWIRDGYGDEMVAAFVEGLERRSGTGARLAFTARAIADAARSGLRERRRKGPWTKGRSTTTTGGGGMAAGEWWTDVRVALRSLRRTPGFTLAATLILALGIGANTALFSAIRGALLTAPPFPEPERIALLDLTDASTVRGDPPRPIPWSYPKYRVLAEAEGLPLEAVAAYAYRTVTLTGVGDATVVSAEVATPGYLRVLGVTPLLGRGFAPGDDGEESEIVALLSHTLWMERFAGDPGILGRVIDLNGQGATVVGVLPAGFDGLTGTARIWITPHGGARLISPFLTRGAQAHWLQAVGRLRPGASFETLRERMAVVGEAAEAVAPETDPTLVRSASARSLMDVRVGERARRSLVVLALASGLLLLVASANLGGLLMARATARRHEAAVRAALGAGRWRVARGSLAESLVLALLGGVASVVVAWGASTWLVDAWPGSSLSSAWNVDVVEIGGGLNVAALAFAGGLAVVVGVVLGLVPVVISGRARPGDHLREGQVGRRRRRGGGIPGALVAGEVAVALVLLVGAGLLLRSLQALQDVERGYEEGDLLTFQVTPPRTSSWADDPAAFHQQIAERLAALPEVEAVGMGCVAPVAGHCLITGVRWAGDRRWSEGSRPGIGVHYVNDDWFATLGIPVRRGRTFDARDQRESPPVVVLSERAALELFPEGEALGRRVAMGIALTPEEGNGGAEVIGVVGDVLYDRPENGLMAEAYISHRQEDSYGTFVVRTRGEPLAGVRALRAAVAEVDPDAPLVSLRTLAEVEASATADTRVLGMLLTSFAALALLLACTGVWAAVAFAVARRTREFGLRLALGARPGQVVQSVVGGGLGVALAGVAVGLAIAAYASRLLSSLLFDVGAGDPVAFGGGAALLLAVAAAAAWLPARRATRVDPVESLRVE